MGIKFFNLFLVKTKLNIFFKDLFRGAKQKQMEKFPADVATSETLTGGDPNIIDDEEFAPKEKKSSWASIFQDTKKQNKNKSTPNRKGRTVVNSPTKITPKNNIIRQIYEIRDLSRVTPSTSSTPTTPAAYNCNICGFVSNRQNVIILHNKTHANDSFKSPVRKGFKPVANNKLFPVKRAQKIKNVISDSETDEPVEEIVKTPAKRGRKRKNQTSNAKIVKKKTISESEIRDDSSDTSDVPSKKVKTDVELKYKILADWSDPDTSSDIEEEKNCVVSKNKKEILILSEVKEKKIISVVVPPPVTKYRNIPKKERREFVIEENNVVLVDALIESPVRKSSRKATMSDVESELEITEEATQKSENEKNTELNKRRSSRLTSKDSDNKNASSRNSSISEKIESIPNIALTVNDRPRRYTRKSTKSSSEDEVKKPEIIEDSLDEKIAEIHEETKVVVLTEVVQEVVEEIIPEILTELEDLKDEDKEEELLEEKETVISEIEETIIEANVVEEEIFTEKEEIIPPEIVEEIILEVEPETTIPEEIKPPEITSEEQIVMDEVDNEKEPEITENLNNTKLEDPEEQPSRNDISCFDFNDDDDEVVAKSPPRRRKRTDLEEPKKIEEMDKELESEIDSLLSNTTVPAIPFLVEPSKSEEDIENKNRTLPPKERGKRIFKSRNRNKNSSDFIKSPENVSPTKSESDLPEDDFKLKENGNHLKIEQVIDSIETSEISINAAEVLVNLSETVLNNSQNISTLNESEVEELKEIENIAPVSRKKHLLKAEVENNLIKSEIETVSEEIKPQSPSAVSLSPKQKFVQKHKEQDEIPKESLEIEIPTFKIDKIEKLEKPVPVPVTKPVISPSKQRKPSKPPQKLIKITEQLVKPVIVEDPTFLNDANFEQMKPKVHKTKKIISKRKILPEKLKTPLIIPERAKIINSQTIVETRTDSPILFNQGPIFNASQMVITSKGAIITTQTQATSTTSQIHTKQKVFESSKKCVVSHSSGGTTSKVKVQSQEIIKQPPTSKKISHSKRSIKRCRMTPEELEEMTSKGYIKTMPNGPVLTAEGYKSMRDKKIQNPIKVTKTLEEDVQLINSPELPPLVPLTPSPKRMRHNSDELTLQTNIPPLISTMTSPTQIFCPEVKSPVLQTEQQIILQESELTDVSQEKYIAVPGN